MTTFTFVIPDVTPSLNRLIRGRMNWVSYRRLQREWFFLVKIATENIDIPHAKAFEKRRVDVTSYRLKLLDRDNLVGGMKLLWDAMIAANYIYDDAPTFLETGQIEQKLVKKRKDQRTIVRLTIEEK